MKLVGSTVKPIILEKDLCPIILLHDILDSRYIWKLIAPRIADSTGRLVYLFDARNHGESAWTEEFTLQFMVDDIQELLSAYKISKVVLVGSGMGGSVAMKLALESPESIEKLVVEDMVPKPYPHHGWRDVVLFTIAELKKALEEIPEFSHLFAAKTAIETYLSLHLPYDTNRDCEFAIDVMPLKEDNGKYKWEANLDAIETALKSKDFDLCLTGTYDGEALFLCGNDSDFNVLENEDVLKLFPKAFRFTVDGAIRMKYFNMSEKFVRYIVSFINGLPFPESTLQKQSLTECFDDVTCG